MSPHSLIGHTVEVFEIFRAKPEIPADAVLRKFFHDRRYLGARDRRFIGDLYFNVIKHWRRLEALVADCYDDHAITPERMIAAYLVAIEAQQPADIPHATDALTDRQREEARLTALSEAE